MYNFIFRLNDGSRYIMKGVPNDFVDAIWNDLEEYCEIYESDTKKVVSVMQVKEC